MCGKYLGYEPNPYRALPSAMRGTYCEVAGNSGNSIGVIFVEARPSKDVVDEDLDDPYGWKSKLTFKIDEEMPWIYRLEYFEVDKADVRHDYDWNVADHAKNFAEHYFCSFDNMVDFIGDEWGVSLRDFKLDHEISIPLG